MNDITTCSGPERARDEARFWASTDRSGDCWIWTGRIDRLGYGRFKIGGTYRTAHRVAYTIVNGDPGSLVVHHACFNRRCVNPSHLAAVTQERNVQMMEGAQINNLSSGVRNVYRNSGGWQVKIGAGGEQHYFGTYSTIAEAAEVAERERLRLHGEYVLSDSAVITEAEISEITAKATAASEMCERGHKRVPGAHCPECMAVASRSHYERNRDRLMERIPCEACGEAMSRMSMRRHHRRKHQEDSK